MTHARGSAENRHDTLSGVTGKSGRGTARQTIRVDEGLWERFGKVAEPDRSTVVRDFIERYVAEHERAEESPPTQSGELPDDRHRSH